MKKLYTSIAVLMLGVVAIAQNNSKSLSPQFSNAHRVSSQTPTIVHKAPLNTHAVGDTVFVFDGHYIYDWNSTLPATFNVQTEDIDGLTIYSGLQGSFGVTGSFVFFYDTVANSNLTYGHPDTLFYGAATSWFTPAGQADNWLELGPIHVPTAGGTLKWRHSIPDPSYRDGYEILVNTAGIASTNFTNAAIFSVTDNDPITAGDTVTTPHYGFVQYSADVNANAGQDIYVAVHHTGNDQFVLLMTDFILLEGSGSGVNENNTVITSLQNMPNPAINNTMISYSLKETANVDFSLFDVAGKKLSSLNQGIQTAGTHQFKLDVSNLSSGIYFYTITAGEYKITNKMSVMK